MEDSGWLILSCCARLRNEVNCFFIILFTLRGLCGTGGLVMQAEDVELESDQR